MTTRTWWILVKRHNGGDWEHTLLHIQETERAAERTAASLSNVLVEYKAIPVNEEEI